MFKVALSVNHRQLLGTFTNASACDIPGITITGCYLSVNWDQCTLSLSVSWAGDIYLNLNHEGYVGMLSGTIPSGATDVQIGPSGGANDYPVMELQIDYDLLPSVQEVEESPGGEILSSPITIIKNPAYTGYRVYRNGIDISGYREESYTGRKWDYWYGVHIVDMSYGDGGGDYGVGGENPLELPSGYSSYQTASQGAYSDKIRVSAGVGGPVTYRMEAISKVEDVETIIDSSELSFTLQSNIITITSYQWYSSPDNNLNNFTPISGANTQEYDDTSVPVGKHRFYVCVMIVDGVTPVYSVVPAEGWSTTDSGTIYKPQILIF